MFCLEMCSMSADIPQSPTSAADRFMSPGSGAKRRLFGATQEHGSAVTVRPPHAVRFAYLDMYYTVYSFSVVYVVAMNANYSISYDVKNENIRFYRAYINRCRMYRRMLKQSNQGFP